MEPSGPSGASGEPRLVVEPAKHGPLYRRAALGAAPARSYMSDPGAAPGSNGGELRELRADRCDDRCQRCVVAAPAAGIERAYRRPAKADAAPASQPKPRDWKLSDPPPRDDRRPPPPLGLPSVPLPLDRAEWCSETTAPNLRRFGSHSDPGPSAAEADKGNQDFAFHLELSAPDGSIWVLVGVADGVSQATWSARGARHVSGAFVEAVDELLRHADAPQGSDGLGGEQWSRAFAELYHRRVLDRLGRDRDRLLEGRHVDSTWEAAAYERMFLSGPNAARDVKKKWFQSTLLAVALGPHGGFGLFLGDGFVRVDRRMPGGAWQPTAGLDPGAPVSLGITKDAVFRGIVRLARKGADTLGVLVMTDGVSKSPTAGIARAMEGIGSLQGVRSDNPLERLAPASSEECAAFLRALASLPTGMVDVDNMSLAFASRALDAPRSP